MWRHALIVVCPLKLHKLKILFFSLIQERLCDIKEKNIQGVYGLTKPLPDSESATCLTEIAASFTSDDFDHRAFFPLPPIFLRVAAPFVSGGDFVFFLPSHDASVV